MLGKHPERAFLHAQCYTNRLTPDCSSRESSGETALFFAIMTTRLTWASLASASSSSRRRESMSKSPSPAMAMRDGISCAYPHAWVALLLPCLRWEGWLSRNDGERGEGDGERTGTKMLDEPMEHLFRTFYSKLPRTSTKHWHVPLACSGVCVPCALTTTAEKTQLSLSCSRFTGEGKRKEARAHIDRDCLLSRD